MTESHEQHSGGADPSWRSLWLSSGALSLSQLGDSLIYIVLPVSAELFGVSLVWVGVLLAANRIIRTFTYGWIAHFGESIGLRALCVLAACTALVSTAAYGLVQGGFAMLVARCVWGLSYAALLLVALGYAAADTGRTGTRVGASRAIEQVGPLIALLLGTWIAGIVGPRSAFLWMAAGTLLAVGMALALPKQKIVPPRKRGRPVIVPRPGRLDLLIFWVGGGADGVFMMTITLMLSRHMSVEAAMLSAGLVVSLRRLSEMVVAPTSGAIADRFGVRMPLIVASCAIVVGFVLIGAGWLFVGAALMVTARGALSTLIPSAVAAIADGALLSPLARNATWRDIGAAAGPLATGMLLTVATPEQLHLGLAVGYGLTFIWVLSEPRWRTSQSARCMVDEKRI